MSTELTWTVEVSDDEAEALSEFSDDRIREELESILSELASVDSKREDLHDRMNISTEDEEELSGAALETEMRKYLRGERSDPRLD
jgi:uncharacterized membrane protein YukC